MKALFTEFGETIVECGAALAALSVINFAFESGITPLLKILFANTLGV